MKQSVKKEYFHWLIFHVLALNEVFLKAKMKNTLKMNYNTILNKLYYLLRPRNKFKKFVTLFCYGQQNESSWQVIVCQISTGVNSARETTG